MASTEDFGPSSGMGSIPPWAIVFCLISHLMTKSGIPKWDTAFFIQIFQKNLTKTSKSCIMSVL